MDSYPALLDFLREQEFADKLVKVAFKPIIREQKPPQPKGFIPLTPCGTAAKPLNGTCMTSGGLSARPERSACDTCNFLDEKMSFLREETVKRGFKTVDGVHMGPCEIHKEHAHTIGPEGSLYACPGFAGNTPESTGHIDGRARRLPERRGEALREDHRVEGVQRLRVHPGLRRRLLGGAHIELGDMNKPNCHKPSFEAGVVALAHQAARELALAMPPDVSRSEHRQTREEKETSSERQERHEEKGNASPLAGRRLARPPAVRPCVSVKPNIASC